MKPLRLRGFGILLIALAPAALGLVGCYDFAGAKREIRENQAKKNALDADIHQEAQRKEELEKLKP